MGSELGRRISDESMLVQHASIRKNQEAWVFDTCLHYDKLLIDGSKTRYG